MFPASNDDRGHPHRAVRRRGRRPSSSSIPLRGKSVDRDRARSRSTRRATTSPRRRISAARHRATSATELIDHLGVLRQPEQAAGGPAAGAAHPVRPGDAARSWGGARASRTTVGTCPVGEPWASLHRRSSSTWGTTGCWWWTRATWPIPQVRGMYPGRSGAQGDPGRVRLPHAERDGQPAAEASTSSIGLVRSRRSTCQRHAGGPYEIEHSGDAVVQQIIRPTGLLDPTVEVRPAGHPGGRRAGTRSGSGPSATGAGAGDGADQAHGPGADRLLAGAGGSGAVPARRHRHPGAHGHPPGPAPGGVRRPGGDQPAEGGAGSAGGQPGLHPRRRQGGVPAQRAFLDPDHRPGRAQRQRPRDPVRRSGDRQHDPSHRGDPTTPARSRLRTTPSTASPR